MLLAEVAAQCDELLARVSIEVAKLHFVSYTGRMRYLFTNCSPTTIKVRPAGFEPATYGLEDRCSIQLSYGRLIVLLPFYILFSC